MLSKTCKRKTVNLLNGFQYKIYSKHMLLIDSICFLMVTLPFVIFLCLECQVDPGLLLLNVYSVVILSPIWVQHVSHWTLSEGRPLLPTVPSVPETVHN